MTPPRIAFPKITVGGAVLPAKVLQDLIDLRVEQTVDLPSQLLMRLADDNLEHLDGDQFAIGKEIAAEFAGQGGSPRSVFTGAILNITAEQTGDRRELTVEALDYSFKLDTGGTKMRTLLKMTVQDVFSKLAQESGLSMVPEGRLPADRYAHLTQTTTNRAFLDDLALRHGLEWWVEGRALHVGSRPDLARVELVYPQNLLEASARFSNQGGDAEVVVNGWDRQAKRVVTGNAKVVHDPKSDGAAAPLANLRGKAIAAKGASRLLLAPYVADTASEAKTVASGFANRLAANEVTVKGKTLGNPALRVPGWVKLQGIGIRLSGEYFLTRVEHVFGVDLPYETRFVAGGRQPSRLVDLLSSSAGNGSAVPAGLTIGLVTNNNDPEGLGRVKVKLPILASDQESNWARVITPASGTSTGLFMIPEVNDEVLVGFEHSDLRHPVVIGGLWNGKNKPPLATSEAVSNNLVASWIVKTRTGNTLQFFDGRAPAQARVVLTHANGKNQVTVEDQRIEITAAQVGSEFAIKVGQASIAITKQGDITIDGNNITIKGKMKVAVEAGLNLEAKGTTTANFGLSAGGVQVTPANTTVKASGVAQIQAPMVKVG